MIMLFASWCNYVKGETVCPRLCLELPLTEMRLNASLLASDLCFATEQHPLLYNLSSSVRGSDFNKPKHLHFHSQWHCINLYCAAKIMAVIGSAAYKPAGGLVCSEGSQLQTQFHPSVRKRDFIKPQWGIKARRWSDVSGLWHLCLW